MLSPSSPKWCNYQIFFLSTWRKCTHLGKVSKKKEEGAVFMFVNVFASDYPPRKKKKIAWALSVFWGCAVCCGWGGQWSIFFPITLLHTCGSFTFMVIQIMKLSIQEILWWEQWTQLPPAACEMGWQTLRQMGEAAVGRQSNHIHLARFPFPLFMFSAATYQQAGAKEPEIITCTPTIRQTHTFTNTLPEVHSTPPQCSPSVAHH